MKSPSKSAEILLAALIGAAAFSVLVSIDAFDSLIDFTRAHESWELDEIILGIWVALVTGLAVTVRHLLMELSRRKTLVRELEKEMRRSEELSRMKSDFLSMVSHELRTPLTAIIGFAKLSKKNLDAIASQEHCDTEAMAKLNRIEDNTSIIISEGARLSELVSNVLDLAKIESGQYEWENAPVFMPDVLRQSMNATQVLFSDKGLSFESRIDADLPMLTGDADRLVQVCINLLANAAKFTSKGGVTLTARAEGADIVVRVEDTGIGVPEAEANSIFNKFRQLGNTLTDKPKGTGLGLPICKEIVEHHGGSIRCEQNPVGGSSFVFSIPSDRQAD